MKMPMQPTLSARGLKVKTVLSVIILISNAFAWYFAAYFLIVRFVDDVGLGAIETIAVWGVNSFAAAVSALLMSGRTLRLISREQLLVLWMLMGGIVTLVPLALAPANLAELLLLSLLWGLFFGLGMPFAMEYYTDSTPLQHRGKVGGVTFLLSYSSNFLFGIVGSMDVTTIVLCLALWRIAGLAMFLGLRSRAEGRCEGVELPSYSSILRERSFILYIVPWAMFSLINYLNLPILSGFFGSDFVAWSSLVEGFVIGLSALAGGFMCDIFGRKRLIVLGFVAVGVGYAVLSVFPEAIVGWYLYTFLDGVAWGMFGVTFLTALWGDLANEKPSRKHYALGGLPYLFANVLQVLIGKDPADSISVFAVFPLTSLFLFLAVLPLIYAPETLPEKQMKDRELRQYVEKAKRAKEKYA
jgi:MFS family permease